jgi:hypothetical protein
VAGAAEKLLAVVRFSMKPQQPETTLKALRGEFTAAACMIGVVTIGAMIVMGMQ